MAKDKKKLKESEERLQRSVAKEIEAYAVGHGFSEARTANVRKRIATLQVVIQNRMQASKGVFAGGQDAARIGSLPITWDSTGYTFDSTHRTFDLTRIPFP